jgi:GT2 family glycosyltransferase
MIRLSIIIVTWNSESDIRGCLASIGRNPAWEVLVVDNASEDQTVSIVTTEFPWVRFIANRENRGYAKANNQGIALSRGNYILLLNPDTVIVDAALTSMIDFMEKHPGFGALGPQLLNPDRTVQPSCREFPTYQILFWEFFGFSRLFPRSGIFGRWRMGYFDHRNEREVDQPMGSCLLIRKTVLERVGGFDEQFPMFLNDVDLCYRIKQSGTKIVFLPQASVIHYKGKSTSRVRPRMIVSAHRSFYRYFKKHFRPNFLQRALIAGFFFLITPLRLFVGSKSL